MDEFLNNTFPRPVVDQSHTHVYNFTGTRTSNNTAAGLQHLGNWSFTSNPTYRVGELVLLWTLPIIITIGIVGNILSFIVMIQREMRQTSTFLYLAVLAPADTIVLFMSAFKTWIRLCSGFEMLHISDASCKIFMFLTYFSLHLSAWLIVAVTIERFIVVWFPLKATSICSTSRAKLVTLCIALALFLLNAHLFWTANLIMDHSSGWKCAMPQNNKVLYENVLPWVHLTMYSLVPNVLLLVLNILIILSLVKHRQIITNQMTKDDRRARYNHRRLAITLLCVSFVWIVTTTPSALYTVLNLKPSSKQMEANFWLIKFMCYILLYVNHSINFFLYCITGQSFRKELMKLLRQPCHKTRKPKPRLMFQTSRSGSGQETTFPLMDNAFRHRGNLCCTGIGDSFTRQSPGNFTKQSPAMSAVAIARHPSSIL